MNNRRRLIIIIVSIGCGSLLSLWIVKKRMGVLKPQDYVQLGFNFFFAVAIVVGIGLLLKNVNKNPPDPPSDQEGSNHQ